MKKIVFLLILVGLVAGGYWYYQLSKTSPEASLLQIREALEARDTEKLQKYIDFKRTSQSIVEESQNMVLDFLPEALRGPVSLIGKGLKLRRSVTTAVRQELINGFETATDQKVPELSDLVKHLPVSKVINEKTLPKLEFEGIENVEKDDSVAIVSLKVRPVNQTESIMVDLRMIDKGDYWQVVGVPNFKEVLPKLITIGRKKEE
ncbi:DUF2939 domain-containing protein [Rufibacter roseus]|uniref:DUF2939 domain-containing protein n=1 Tax=Rufibacter roseus TaxID=1567108 RepID=A0ABW2DII9_9BACT|nr:DUF2939 domain-containing protein [Rufibacter roseus]